MTIKSQMPFGRSHPVRAFSLIELVIVVVIIAMLAAIAIPRMSRGAEGAAQGALDGDLAVLRSAIDRYAAEHLSAFPGLATFDAQMTMYTDSASGTSATKDATHIYGPYLRRIPPLPLGQWRGKTDLKSPAAIPPVTEKGNCGWLYDETSGQIWANASGYFDR